MKGAFVAGASIVTALGNSSREMWPRLCTGQSAVGPVRRFQTDGLEFHDGACVEGLDALSGTNMVCELAARVLDGIKPLPEDAFVIWTGIKGNVQHIENMAEGKGMIPLYLPVHYRNWVCEYLGIAGRGIEVNAACASSTVGLALGAQMISDGRCSSVLVCAADIVSRFIFTGFSSLRALSATTCRPFDRSRDGLCLGDGAAAVFLADADTCSKLNLRPAARLTGWGIANDANHITGPARDGRGLVNAIGSALRQARLSPDSIEAYCAHGTGTPYNDAMELTAVETLFGGRRFPLFSIKGAVGHTLGAAGAIEAAIAVTSLTEGNVPLTAGLEKPEDRAVGRVSREVRPFAGNNILTTNSGFGGCNAALIFERT